MFLDGTTNTKTYCKKAAALMLADLGSSVPGALKKAYQCCCVVLIHCSAGNYGRGRVRPDSCSRHAPSRRREGIGVRHETFSHWFAEITALSLSDALNIAVVLFLKRRGW